MQEVPATLNSPEFRATLRLALAKAVPMIRLIALFLVLVAVPAAAQSNIQRWEQQRQRDIEVDRQNDRAYQQRQLQRDQQERQRAFDQIEIDRRQIQNQRLERRPLEYDQRPNVVIVPQQQQTCRQYTQAYDTAGRPLGLICLR